MSYHATSWAKGVRTGSPSRKAVLMILAEHCDQWGYAWAGVELIAAEAELGAKQVRRLLHELVARGLIDLLAPVRPGRGRTNLYRFPDCCGNPNARTMPPEHPSLSPTFRAGADPSPGSGAGSEKGDKMSSIPGGGKADIGGPETGHPAPENLPPMSSEPVRTSLEPARARGAAAPDGAAPRPRDDTRDQQQTDAGGAVGPCHPAPPGRSEAASNADVAASEPPNPTAPNPTAEARAQWLAGQPAIRAAVESEARRQQAAMDEARQRWAAALARLAAEGWDGPEGPVRPPLDDALPDGPLAPLAAVEPHDLARLVDGRQVLHVALPAGDGGGALDWLGQPAVAAMEALLGLPLLPRRPEALATPARIRAAGRDLLPRLFCLRAEAGLSARGGVSFGVQERALQLEADLCLRAALQAALGRPVEFVLHRQADAIAAQIRADHPEAFAPAGAGEAFPTNPVLEAAAP